MPYLVITSTSVPNACFKLQLCACVLNSTYVYDVCMCVCVCVCECVRVCIECLCEKNINKLFCAVLLLQYTILKVKSRNIYYFLVMG